MENNKFAVGDLVQLLDCFDPDRRLGIVVAISPSPSHLVGNGTVRVVQVYWPTIDDFDWEYDFFLRKISKDNLTEDQQ